MPIHEDYWDERTSLVGLRFEFTSGKIALVGCTGRVLEVVEAPDASGRPGQVVIHSLDGQEGQWHTAWSHFREHATLASAYPRLAE